MEQLILHLIGDYVTQSDWMAQNKAKSFWPAWIHAGIYSLPFLLLGPSKVAITVIFLSHFLIDRYRLARFVVYAKNVFLFPWFMSEVWQLQSERGDTDARRKLDEWGVLCDWNECNATGYPSDRPAWLAVWLLIAADNTLHLAINYASLRWL